MLAPSEKEIQNAILDYLATRADVMAWPTASVGLWDPTKRTYRRPGKHFLRGVADIIGIAAGQFLAIEVKTPKGRVSPEQDAFLSEIRRRGGIAFVARSVDDVIAEFTKRVWFRGA